MILFLCGILSIQIVLVKFYIDKNGDKICRNKRSIVSTESSRSAMKVKERRTLHIENTVNGIDAKWSAIESSELPCFTVACRILRLMFNNYVGVKTSAQCVILK